MTLVSRLQQVSDVARREAVASGFVAFHTQADLRNLDLRLDLQIDDAGDRLHPVLHVVGGGAEFAQVLAEDFHGNLRANAGHHVIEPVRNRLTDVDGRSGDGRDAVADVGDDLFTRSANGLITPQMCDRN